MGTKGTTCQGPAASQLTHMPGSDGWRRAPPAEQGHRAGKAENRWKGENGRPPAGIHPDHRLLMRDAPVPGDRLPSNMGIWPGTQVHGAPCHGGIPV